MRGHDESAHGLTHLGISPEPADLGINITAVPLTDSERHDTSTALRFAALLVEDRNPDYAKELYGLAGLFADGAFAPFDTPLAARFLQVRRERDEATRLVFEAHELVAALADRVEALTGVEV